MIPKILFSTYVLLFIGQCYTTEIELEEGVLVLKQSNFDDAVKNNEYLLVEFYAPWCGHCKHLAPEYAKAATKLTELNSNIKLAKVDATQETKLAEKYDVRGYPTLKFFRNSQPIDYTGGRQADDIVSWVQKKSGPPATTLGSVSEVKNFIDENKVAIVGYFNDLESEGAKRFLDVASAIDDHRFGIASDSAVLSEYCSGGGDKVVLYKKFDEGQSTFEGNLEDPQELSKFIATEALPLIIEFNHETAQKIFGGDVKKHFLMFVSQKAGHFEKYLEPIKPIAKEFKGALLFVGINSDEPDHNRILEFFGLAEEDVPQMRIIHLEEEMKKYKPHENDLSPENVKAFVKAFIAGELKEHLLSQKLPEDWDKAPVKVLVSDNFDKVVLDKDKDVLVEFYAPWCGHCKHLAPIYDKLAEAFEDRDDILIAKIDSTANELETLKIVNYPTIKLFKKGDNEIIDYNGDRTLEGLTKFLNSGGEYGQGVPEKTDEEEEEEDDQPKKDEL